MKDMYKIVLQKLKKESPMANPLPVRFTEKQREEISQKAKEWNLSEQDTIRLSLHVGIGQLTDFINRKRKPLKTTKGSAA
jgi:hypothetical protein